MILNEWNRNAFHFFDATYKDIKKITQPYMDHIGATKMVYFKIFQGGKHFLYSNERSLVKNSIFSFQENSPIFMDIIRSVRHDSCSFHASLSKGTDPVICFYQENWGNISSVYRRHENYVDVVAFTNHLNPHVHASYCTNHIPVLKSLYWMVRETFLQHISMDQKDVYAYYPKGGDITYHKKPKIYVENSCHRFLNQKFPKILSHYHPYLSHREWEVCRGLMRGETAKETAESLNIEKRTVENHLQNIYRKLAEKWGFRPSRAHILEKFYDTMDKDLLKFILWGQ